MQNPCKGKFHLIHSKVLANAVPRVRTQYYDKRESTANVICCFLSNVNVDRQTECSVIDLFPAEKGMKAYGLRDFMFSSVNRSGRNSCKQNKPKKKN